MWAPPQLLLSGSTTSWMLLPAGWLFLPQQACEVAKWPAQIWFRHPGESTRMGDVSPPISTITVNGTRNHLMHVSVSFGSNLRVKSLIGFLSLQLWWWARPHLVKIRAARGGVAISLWQWVCDMGKWEILTMPSFIYVTLLEWASHSSQVT